MPRIEIITPEYSSRAGLPGRGATAADFGNAGLSSLGAGVTGIADKLQAKEEAAELSEVEVRLAEAYARAQTKLREDLTRAQPGDVEFADRFNNSFAEALDASSSGLQTRKGQLAFFQGARKLKASMHELANAGQARLAGAKAKVDYERLLNANQQIVMTAPDDLPDVAADMMSGIREGNGWYGNLDRPTRDALALQAGQKLAQSAVQGYIEQDPELAKAKLLAGQFDHLLDADTKKQLLATSDVAIRAADSETERLQRAAEKAEAVAREKTADTFIQQLFDNPTSLSPKEIAMSNLTATQKEHYLELQETRMRNPVTRSNPETFTTLLARIHLPASDPFKLRTEQELLDGVITRDLSFEDMVKLRKEFQDARTPEGERLGVTMKNFLDSVKPGIGKPNMLGNLDPTGAQNFYLFQQFVGQKVEEARAKGEDPFVLFDGNEANDQFLGRPETLSRFQNTLQDSLRYLTERMRAAPRPAGTTEPRKAGETVQQYLKRTGN